jgi:hypothetical protein
MSRQEQFTDSLPFKIIGKLYWPLQGQPRDATDGEKLLWKKCLEFIGEIDLIQPVDVCKHERKIVYKAPPGQQGNNVKCALCHEFLYQQGTEKGR